MARRDIIIGNNETVYSESLNTGAVLPLIDEFNDNLIAEVKNNVFFYYQPRHWYTDQARNNRITNNLVPSNTTLYRWGAIFGQPNRNVTQYSFFQGQGGSYIFTIDSVGRNAFLPTGTYTNNGVISSSGNWVISVSQNNSQRLTVTLQPSSTLQNSTGSGAFNVLIPFKLYNSNITHNTTTELGTVSIRVEFYYEPTGGCD